ncbi:shikimate kinase [Brachyspira pilosicoli]|uniref:Shikimate kinase n=1 Tax=Brachyspira pilosicoli TaxID=52584 RepID=A0A5C8EEC8_BRAPL|nr:shikimate kinase [Brachyspira pilosicoli]TXJ36427.1 shikimate kinase [Brachyspira pilosicoli]
MNNSEKTIFVIGLPGSGKTDLSKLLADYINYTFFDMDKVIEDKEKKTISKIFEDSGEEYFREVESNVLEELSNIKNAVISTGGGTVLKDKNRTLMRVRGIVIFIDRPADIIINNINVSERPLLVHDKNKLIELSKKRDALYRECAEVIFNHNTWDNDIKETFKKFYECICKYI